jgi:hypothetical protein
VPKAWVLGHRLWVQVLTLSLVKWSWTNALALLVLFFIF